MAKVIGLILMGGLNSRMGGAKKALLTYHGKAFYEYVAEAMRMAGVEEVYASVEKLWQAELGLSQVVDGYDRIGPLGGIVSMLEAVWERAEKDMPSAEGVLVCPCDLPFMKAEVLEKLLETFAETKKPVVLTCDGRANPLVAIYTKDCLPVLKAQLTTENYKAGLWMEQVAHVKVPLAKSEERALSNINSKEEYMTLVSKE